MKVLAQEEFRVGQIVVGMGKPAKPASESGPATMGDGSFRGDFFRVEAIDLPFCLLLPVRNRFGNCHDKDPMNEDLRDGFEYGMPSEDMLRKAGLGDYIASTHIQTV